LTYTNVFSIVSQNFNLNLM